MKSTFKGLCFEALNNESKLITANIEAESALKKLREIVDFFV